MKTVICNGSKITLNDKSFLASGGQADLYLVKGKVYKVYTSAVEPRLADKFLELSALDKKNIIRPLDILYDPNTMDPVGYTMDYVDNTIGLPLLFTSSFLSRNNITNTAIQDLVKDMGETTSFIHSKGIVLADGNEYNYLVSKAGFKDSFFIDVDSYQTKNFPAVVIMPSIRDYCTKGFSELTDFYSFGVVTFQLFTGIHPYKGKHPVYKTIEERCKHHISVFNKDVTLPSAIRDFGAIPSNYRTWYEDIFEKGQRIPPPSIISAPILATRRKVVTSTFNIEKVFEAESAITRVEWVYGHNVIYTKENIYINQKKYTRHDPHSVVIPATDGTLFEVYYTDEGLVTCDIIRGLSEIQSSYKASNWFSINGRLYSIYDSQIFELNLVKQSVMKTLVTVLYSQRIPEQSLKIFANVLYADLFGKAYFYIPAPKAMQIKEIPELYKARIIDAKFERDQLIVISADSAGIIQKSIISSQKEIVKDVPMQETNFTTLSNGLSIAYDADEDEIDINTIGTFSHKIFKNAGLPKALTLVSTGVLAHYFVDNCLYKFSVR